MNKQNGYVSTINEDLVKSGLEISTFDNNQNKKFVAKTYLEMAKLIASDKEYVEVKSLTNTYFSIADSTYSSKVITEGDSMCTNFNNSSCDIRAFLKAFLSHDIIQKYDIVRIITFNDEKEVWVIVKGLDYKKYKSLHGVTFTFKKQISTDLKCLIIENSEIDYSILPEHSDNVEVV